MRPADDEPERSVGRRTIPRLLVPLVVVGAATIVVSAAIEGKARFALFSFGGGAPSDPLAPPSIESTAPAQPTTERLDPIVSATAQTVLQVLACIVALVIAALLVRMIVAAVRARRRRTGPKRLHTVGADADQVVADAPAVLRGIAAALQAFEEHREPSDAVVRAWLGLQQAAEDGGFARSASETPTEFTGRVLTRTGADRVALRTLLRLYLRARFGDGAISDADAADARSALLALEASWELGTVASRG